MSKMNEIRGDQFATCAVPAEATAGSVDEWPVFLAPYDCTITAASWVPAAAVTGDSTNNFILTVNNLTDGNIVTTAKTYATGTDSVANVAEALTVSGAGATVAAGDVITMKRTKTGTGLASPAGLVRLTYKLR